MNSDDQIIDNVRLELIKKLESILADLKGESVTEPKHDFDHTFIYIYESAGYKKFEYTKRFEDKTKIDYEYKKRF